MGFEKNLLVDITIAFLGLPQHIKLSNARKMMKYGFSLILIFLYLEQNLRVCWNTGKYGYDFVHVWENTD